MIYENNIIALLLISAFASATDAAVNTPPTVTATSSLEGWGPYKFGMTAEQVRDVGYINAPCGVFEGIGI